MSVLDRASHTLLLVSVGLLLLMGLLNGYVALCFILIGLALGWVGGLHWCEYMDEQTAANVEAERVQAAPPGGAA